MENEVSSIASFLNLEEMEEGEASALIEEAGKLIVESAITRFIIEADEEEVRALESILANEQDVAAAMPKIIELVPRFGDVLNEEVAAFRMRAEELA